MPSLRASRLDAADLSELVEALAHADLPVDDIDERGRTFLRFRDNAGQTIGYGGLEIHGSHALLRSIAVVPAEQGKGWGGEIVEHLVRYARDAGAAQAYLLTTSAQGFFESKGFSVVARSGVPAEILSTRQAVSLCPASAVVLTRLIPQ